MQIVSYKEQYKEALLQLIRLNTPHYFAAEEEQDFSGYLDTEKEDYFVVLEENKVIACGGINYMPDGITARISWDIVHPDFQGRGVGMKLLQHRLHHIDTMPHIKNIEVRTSQLATAFYAKAGFVTIEIRKDFWGKGLDLYWMRLSERKSV